MNLQTLLTAIIDHQASIGFFESVSQHEPKNDPGPGVTAATWVQDVRPVQAASGLAATSVRVEFTTRLYRDMLGEPADQIDPEMYAAADKLMEAYTGDFQLGGVEGTRNVDLLGAHGEPLRMRAGYLNQGGTLFRILDILTPLVVNDVWDQAA